MLQIYEQVISIEQCVRNPEIDADRIIKGTDSYQTAHVRVVFLTHWTRIFLSTVV